MPPAYESNAVDTPQTRSLGTHLKIVEPVDTHGDEQRFSSPQVSVPAVPGCRYPINPQHTATRLLWCAHPHLKKFPEYGTYPFRGGSCVTLFITCDFPSVTVFVVC